MSATASPSAPAPAPPAGMTIEEFIARYAGTNAEYIDGAVKEPQMVWPRHGKICQNVAGYIWMHARDRELGHVMSNDSWFRTTRTRMRGGDVCYVSYERLPKGPVPQGELDCVPDLVVEVKSPSDGWGELFAKVGEYLQAGVRVVVVVDPDTATASVYRDQGRQQILSQAEVLELPDVLPGLSVPVARLFD